MYEIGFCILAFIVAKFLYDNLMLRIDNDGLKRENEYLKKKLFETPKEGTKNDWENYIQQRNNLWSQEI